MESRASHHFCVLGILGWKQNKGGRVQLYNVVRLMTMPRLIVQLRACIYRQITLSCP